MASPLLASAGAALVTTAASVGYLPAGTDTTLTLVIKTAWAVISIYIIPTLLNFVRNDLIRKALFKAAESFVRSLSEDLLGKQSPEGAWLQERLDEFKVQHPLAAKAEEPLVKMALSAALNRLTQKNPTTGGRSLTRNGASNG